MISLRPRLPNHLRHACFGAACLVLACVDDEGPPADGSTSDAPADTSTTAMPPDMGESSNASSGSSTGVTPDPSTSSGEDAAEGASTGEPVCEIPTPLDVAPESLCAAQEVVQAYQPGMVAHGELGLLDVVLVEAEPGPPIEGFNGWTLLVRDVATCTPQPGITLGVIPFMPMHGHGSPTIPRITDNGDGTYSVDPVNLWMGGYWRVRVELASEALGEDETAFHICIE